MIYCIRINSTFICSVAPVLQTFFQKTMEKIHITPASAAKRMGKIRQRAADESDKVIGAEVGRALLSATMGRDAQVSASLNNFSGPIAEANMSQHQINLRAELQAQILRELDTFLGLADLSLLRLKLQQQQEQNCKLLQMNKRIAKRTTDSLIRAAHTGDSSILLQQLSTDELESIKLASMSLSGGESDTGGEKNSGSSSNGGGGSVSGGRIPKHQTKDKAKASNRRRKVKDKERRRRRKKTKKSLSPDRGRELLIRSDVQKARTSTTCTNNY